MDFPDWSLNDKVAIVTGASRGLGRAIALTYANAGAAVVLASRNEERLKQVAAEISQMGREALHKATNITKEDDVIDLARAAFDEFGKIDILVNNAGTIVRKNAVDISTNVEKDRGQQPAGQDGQTTRVDGSRHILCPRCLQLCHRQLPVYRRWLEYRLDGQITV